MANKEHKYLVHAELHEISDIYDDRVIEIHEIERTGVSEKQVISRVRWTYKWYDYDNFDGSRFYEWRFKLTLLDLDGTNCEQLKLF